MDGARGRAMPNGQPRVVRRRTSTEADAPVRKRSRPANSEQPEDQTQPPGFIKNITLKNFMCHEHLTLDLNERLNFIKGQNGSGKSAVLTAVMVGLGARTSTTDRGTSIAKLIRTDQRSAVVSVTLNNSGHYAILPEKFGNSFTVERTIRDGGSSAYRISNEKGKLGPMKKGDLVSILDGLNIQVDNPLVILTQETSKNFLRGDDPKKKYNLFLDATRLSHIERWHEKTRKSQMSTKNALEVKEQSLEARKKQAKEYEREVNFHKNRDNVKEKIKMLELNLLWAKVMEEEKALEAAKAGQKKKEEEMKAIVTRTENREQKLQEKRELKQKKERLDQERTEAAGRVNQLKKKLRDELEVQQRAAAVRIRQAETRFDDQVRDRENLKTEIARRRNEAQPDLETEAQRRQQAMAELEGELNELDAAEKTRAGHLQNVSGTLQRQKDELKQGEDERRELDNKIKELDAQVRRCQANQTNPRAVFGSWVGHVDRAIETSWQQRKFRKKPIGPIGAYVRVRADCEEWKPLVETCLSGVLRAYLVDDQSDLRVMSAILKEHTHNERDKPRVIASKFLSEIHDVSRLGIDTSSGEHVSVWSVLEIDNPVVANAVIDQARVEAVLLLRTEEEAHSKLAFKERVPHGCSQALTMAGNRYFPDPSYRTYPIKVPRQARFLQVSMQEVISDLSRQLQEKRDDAQETVGRLDPARTALKENQRRESEARRQLEETRRQKQTVRRRLRELQDQQEPEPSNLQALEDEVKELDRIIAELEASVDPLTEKKKEIDRQVQECKKSKKEAEEAVKAKLDELEALRTELGQVEKLQSDLEKLREALQSRQRELTQLTATVAELQQRTERATDTAAAAGERTHHKYQVKELEGRVRGLKRSLDNADAEQPRLSGEEALDRFQTAQLNCQLIEKDMAFEKETLTKIDEMISERDNSLRKLRMSLGSRVTSYFSTILAARNFGGSMMFDHNNQKLEIEVSPNQRDGGGEHAGRATSQLSGGERSFSTLAFVMAMWNTMHSPFRMLDEYDVFMDDAHRKIGHDMLVNNALQHNSQFAFFTPLSIPSKHDGDSRINILQMRPPNRDGH